MSDQRVYTTVTVKVNRAQDTEAVEKKIKDLGFNAFSIADLLESQKKAFILLDLLLGLVGSIALTVASLGIVNTMVMSILERTREIGVMKAVGGGDADVRKIFLVEASLIGLFGGVFGIALGWAVGRVINAGANYYLSDAGRPGRQPVPDSVVADGGRHRLRPAREPGGGQLPRHARRAARSDPGAPP